MPRSRRHTLLLVVLALGALATSLYLISSSRKRERTRDPTTARAGSSDGRPSAAPRAPSSGPEAASSRDRLDSDDDPTGEFRLEGQVVDADEKPVAGARVGIDSNPRRDVVTEADGSFEFERLVAREYLLEARLDDRHAGPVAVRLTPRSDPVILRLRAAAALEVTVVDAETRAPVSGASVELRGTMIESATTGSDGKARLTIGEHWIALAVLAPGYAPARRMIETAGAPGTVERQLVELVRGAPVSGQVVDAAGRPVAGARVLPDEASQPFPVVDSRRDAAITDAAGAFRFATLPAGTFRFAVTHPDHAPGTSGSVVLDGVTPRDDVEIALEAPARIAGRVVLPSGEPVAATIRVSPRGGGFAWFIGRQAYTRPDGTFDIGALPRRAVDVVAARVDASSRIVAIDLTLGNALDLVLTLDVGSAIAGVVVNSSGEPIPEAQVLAEPEWSRGPDERREWNLRGLPEDVADAGGRFHLGGLPPGTYRLRAARPGKPPGALWLSGGTAAQTGDTAVRLAVASDGGVKGRVLFDDGSPPSSFAIAAGWSAPTPFAGDEGRFSLVLPGGAHALAVTGATFVKKIVTEVEVIEGKETDLGTITVERGRSISGRVVDIDGRPVAGASVAAGSLLTGTGAELNVPSEGFGVKETTTGDDGGFVVTGLAPGALVVVAEQASIGRSLSVRIPPAIPHAQLELVLLSTGSLEGTLTQAGQPVGGTVVIASPAAAPGSNFFVMSGPDGSYRFDRLTADDYLLQIMIGGGGGRPNDVYVQPVTVTPGLEARLDVEIPRGGATLTVEVVGEKAAPFVAARVTAITGRHASTRREDLQGAFDRGGSVHNRISMGGAPATFEALVPGTYTVCALAVAADIHDPGKLQELMQRAEQLPIGCAHAELRDGPQQLSVTAPVSR